MNKPNSVEDKLNSWAAECLFGSTYLLLSLCDRERQLKFYREFYYKDGKLPTHFFHGFKLAFATLLYNIARQTIQAPEIIGVRKSKKIDWAYHFGSNEKSSLHKLPNSSAQGVLVTNLLTFRKKILESKNWDSFWKTIESLQDFLYPFQEIFLSCYVGEIDQSDEVASPENALKTKLPEVILIFMNDANILRLAFNEMYRIHPQTKRLDQYKIPLDPKRSQTDEDSFDFFHEILHKSRAKYLETSDKGAIFLEGFKFANISLWKQALEENEFANSIHLFKEIQKSTSWTAFDEAFDKINSNVVSQFEKKNKTNKTNLVLVKKIPNSLIHKLVVPIEKPKSVKKQLSDVLNHRPAKVISYEGSNGASQFCTVLLGLVYEHKLGIMKEKVQVIEFVHKQKIRGNNYSYGLFIPTSSNIADYSKWWIFYSCATDHTGYGGSCFAQICSYLKSLKPFIHYKKFSINEKKFFEHFKSDYIKFIEKECRKVTDQNSSLRGAFLELLVALIFVKSGYNVRLRHRSKLLGRKEIDVIATKQDGKTDVIYVVECKERSLTADSEEFHRISNEIFTKAKENKKGFISASQADAMYKIIEDFENQKVTPLKIKSQEFAKEIHYSFTENTKVIGLVATTELFDTPTKISQNIELWTYWTLKKKLQENKIDKSFIKIIENYLNGTVGRPISDLNFYKDYFE